MIGLIEANMVLSLPLPLCIFNTLKQRKVVALLTSKKKIFKYMKLPLSATKVYGFNTTCIIKYTLLVMGLLNMIMKQNVNLEGKMIFFPLI
jgi:hypothetical protein